MKTFEPVLRRARDEDSGAVAGVWLRSFAAALPSVRAVHTDDQIRLWIRDTVIQVHETWVLCLEEKVAGMLTLDEAEIDQLYLDPAWRHRGLGDVLIAHAKARRPDGLALWTFQVNVTAYRFYQRHGFRETARTDGSHNEECEPDIRMAWHPADSWPA